jgi:alkylation response protein AidB-like acyl-CoA dehydrogenase
VYESPLTTAARLGALALAHREETDSLRQLPDPVVRELAASGLCRLSLPREEGGGGVAPLEALEVYEELAAAEASLAWIAWNNSLVCWFARYLDPGVRREIFRETGSLYANSTRPTGRAASTPGGFVVSGRWSLVSGCMHASWIAVMALVTDGGAVRMAAPGVPDMRMFYVPRERFEIVDTWHSGGLRGTGSHDVALTKELVEPSKAISPIFGESSVDSPFGRVPVVVTMAAGCAAICFGIARASLDALLELGRSRVTPGPEPDLRDRPRNQLAVAKACAQLAAARGEVRRRYARLWDKIAQGDRPQADDIAQVFAATTTAALQCRDMVTELYAAAGTAALYIDSPLERAHRDIHAVLQHVVVQPAWLEDAGRVMFGLEPTMPIFAV